MSLRVGLVGATGVVGQEFIKIVEETKFPLSSVKLFASQKSDQRTMNVNGKAVPVQGLENGCFDKLDFVFFTAGEEASLQWAPQAVSAGAWVIDNSAAFRMDADKTLMVPEVNWTSLVKEKPQIIANPNCSVIQFVVVLSALEKAFGLQSVKVATYQSVSGAGLPAVQELKAQTKALMMEQKEPEPKVFSHPIAFNSIPQIGSFDASGFTGEEIKVIKETRKILDLPRLPISAWTIRVPSMVGHSEASWITLKKKVSQEEVISCLEKAPGVSVFRQTPTTWSNYPTARFSEGKNPSFVGRIHSDWEDPMTWLMWIVSDNLRKGAALNGLQIAARLFDTPYPS